MHINTDRFNEQSRRVRIHQFETYLLVLGDAEDHKISLQSDSQIVVKKVLKALEKEQRKHDRYEPKMAKTYIEMLNESIDYGDSK